MAWATPATKSTGNVIGATDWNELVTDLRWLGQVDSDGRPVCIAYRSTDQTISNNTDTAVTWNAEVLDNAAAHSTSINTSRFSAPVDGWYRLTGRLYFASNATGMRGAFPLFNGAGTKLSYGYWNGNIYGFEASMDVIAVKQMTAGQYIEISVYQNSGGNLALKGSATAIQSFAVFEWIAKY